MQERITEDQFREYFVKYTGIFKVLDIFEEYFGKDRVELLYSVDSGIEAAIKNAYNVYETFWGDPDNTGLLESVFTKPEQYMDYLRSNFPEVTQEELNKFNNSAEAIIMGERGDHDPSIMVPYIGWAIVTRDSPLYITVYFPEIEISNEVNETHLLREVWVRVPLTVKGCLSETFHVARTLYTTQEAASGYIHSHIRTHSDWDSPKHYFRTMCLGHSPIVSTISTLVSFNLPEVWLLFCAELEMCLRTESLEGGPYKKMRDLGFNGRTESLLMPDRSYKNLYRMFSILSKCGHLESIMKDIISEKKLRFSYYNSSFLLGCSDLEAVFSISNSVINYVNNHEMPREAVDCIKGHILTVKVVDGRLYKIAEPPTLHNTGMLSYRPILYFKGKPIYARCFKEENPQEITYSILKPGIIQTIILILIQTLNARYGKAIQEPVYFQL